MRANKIVIALNVSENISFSLKLGPKILKEYTFEFQAAKEILSNSIIVGTTFTGKRLNDIEVIEKFAKIFRRVLRGAIRVENEII